MIDEQSRARHEEMMSEIRSRIEGLTHSIKNARKPAPRPSNVCKNCGREWEDHQAKPPHALNDSGCKG